MGEESSELSRFLRVFFILAYALRKLVQQLRLKFHVIIFFIIRLKFYQSGCGMESNLIQGD